jgi:hypothetical protein
MARTTSNSSSGEAADRPRNRGRARTADAANTLRPSPALVSWIDRAVSRLTAEPPWTYEDGVPIAVRASAPAPAADAPRARSRAEQAAVPDEVREQFIRVGRDYYFPSGMRAFRDHGTKMVTQSQNTEVVRSLVQIAQARGWQDITVTGTERFKRDTWRIATVSGLIVRGYRPNEFEKQKFVRDLAATREPPRPPEPLVDPPRPRTSRGTAESAAQNVPQQPVSPRAATHDGNGARSPERVNARASAPVAAAPPNGERAYSGALLEHGPAPYEFDSEAEPSYFVRIQTQRGPKVLWGLDFERALQEAKVQPGDDIRVRQAGREKVTVKRRERDEAGRVVNERAVQAHRNQWEIRRDGIAGAEHEKNDRVRGPHAPNADARGATRELPEMEGALLALKGAQLFADQRIKDPAQRTAFVNAVREELTHVLDRDGAVRAPRLRERAPEQVRAAARTLS